jgi:hypothetical protein
MRRGGAYALTPALARESARMGALRARGMGAPACGCEGPPLNGLGSVPRARRIGDVTAATYSAQVQGALAAQSAAVQAQVKDATGVDTQQAAVAKGASSAFGLISNGYNPGSDSDNAQLVHVIAGGLCLVPGIGPLLGGAVEGLWAVGNAVGCPLENAFAAIGFGSPSPACGGHPCTTSGNWTVQSVMQENAGLRALPSMPRGSFAAFVIPMLAYLAAQAADCKGSVPPAIAVDAAVALWNKTHAGPAAAYLVPAMLAGPGGVAPFSLLLAGAGASVTGTTPSARAGQPANIFYAFGPANAAKAEGLAFSGSTVTFNPWATLSAPPGASVTSPRIVMVNTGALLPQAQPIAVHFGGKTLTPKPTLSMHLHGSSLSTAAGARGPAKPMSAGGKVAAAAGVAGAGALAWWLGSHGWKWVTPRWAKALVR